ncbi:MAG: pyruvate dehydrogenase (acetyl-transferring), homodimeric type [Leptospirales bacterium]
MPIKLTKTPYINTISKNSQPAYPGDRALERRLKSIIRWNAMAMVVRANNLHPGLGGHISTYASAATLYETGFQHFFRAPSKDFTGDLVYFQGHASPGIYSRAFLEGRFSQENLENFRRELASAGGLSSYPHPALMQNFWQYPTVSMGLGPLFAIYQARFWRYLENRKIKTKDSSKIWAFLGDGETDEVESLGALLAASRHNLDNLIFVVNCNLQRLDGPVRGNGKIIQELESAFSGAGWKVIKVIWGSDWDELIDADHNFILQNKMESTLDGDYQKYSVESGSYIREHFFSPEPFLQELVSGRSDDQLRKLNRGGHDPVKVYTAYREAAASDRPVVILAKTVKGYGMGESGEGMNITHQQKKLNNEELKKFRTRFDIPLTDKEIIDTPFYKPPEDSLEMQYLFERRKSLGGFLPQRKNYSPGFTQPDPDLFEEFYKGSDGREVSTTMAYVRLLSKLISDKKIGKYIVPIIPDEARTFGIDALFRSIGIYSPEKQKYEPVDSGNLMYYRESPQGQILEEGINEAGAMSTFIAAGTAHSLLQKNLIPFYTYYSMFGAQRVGDLVWAAADSGTRGFLIGATSGRTTLNGEGLQHQDGHSHLLFSVVPHCVCYDPAFAYEISVIVKEGIRRMFEQKENVMYYLTVTNENYVMPEMPKGVEDGILQGIYKFQTSTLENEYKAHLIGSGSILKESIRAANVLEEEYNIACDIWSATSYTQLRTEGLEIDRWNYLHPEEEKKLTYVEKVFEKEKGVFIAASDFVKALPDSISKWLNVISLGTDGFGFSETREKLRDYFEIDYRHIAFVAAGALYREHKIDKELLQKIKTDLNILAEKPGKVWNNTKGETNGV